MAKAKVVAKKVEAPAINLDLLKQIKDATESDVGFMFVGAAAQSLQAEGLIEINGEMMDNDGNVAARITQKGVDSMSATKQVVAFPVQSAPAAAVTAPTSAFKIVTGVEIPTSKRGAKGDRRYPFDDLPVNGSFFVPATAEMPEPVKKLGSTVSSATARYSVPDGEATRTTKNGEVVQKMKPTRQFVMRPISDGAPWGFPGQSGAAIFRRQ